MDDPPPAFIPDGTAAHDLGRDRSVFVMFNQTWHHIPNMEVYGLVLGQTKRGDVKILTSWQFLHYSEGEVVTEADIPRIRAVRDKLLSDGSPKRK
jgi:hypothetical protein